VSPAAPSCSTNERKKKLNYNKNLFKQDYNQQRPGCPKKTNTCLSDDHDFAFDFIYFITFITLKKPAVAPKTKNPNTLLLLLVVLLIFF
jgi:hypothetical protein